jgi:hypothetical protein
MQKSMSGISVHPDAVNIVWELRVKKMVRASTSCLQLDCQLGF